MAKRADETDVEVLSDNSNKSITLDIYSWTPVVNVKRATFRVTIDKKIANYAGIGRGTKLHCYAGKDRNGRPVMLVWLDGNHKDYDPTVPKKE